MSDSMPLEQSHPIPTSARARLRCCTFPRPRSRRRPGQGGRQRRDRTYRQMCTVPPDLLDKRRECVRYASRNQRLFSFEKIRCRHFQRLRQSWEVRHAEIVPSLLDIRDVGPFDLGGVREVLLGPPALQAEAADPLAKLLEKWVGGGGHAASSRARSDQVHGKSATFNRPKMSLPGGQSRVARLDRGAGRALYTE